MVMMNQFTCLYFVAIILCIQPRANLARQPASTYLFHMYQWVDYGQVNDFLVLPTLFPGESDFTQNLIQRAGLVPEKDFAEDFFFHVIYLRICAQFFWFVKCY